MTPVSVLADDEAEEEEVQLPETDMVITLILCSDIITKFQLF